MASRNLGWPHPGRNCPLLDPEWFEGWNEQEAEKDRFGLNFDIKDIETKRASLEAQMAELDQRLEKAKAKLAAHIAKYGDLNPQS